MAVRVHNLVLCVDEPESLLPQKAAERCGILVSAIADWRVVRRSIDPRKGHVRLVYSVDLNVADAAAESVALKSGATMVVEPEPPRVMPGREEVRGRVVVVGCGPAGLFAALELARCGYRPLLIERGGPVEERRRDIGSFHATRRLDPESNILFGAGGAGTYSDGKLHTRIRDPRITSILEQLVVSGAPESIRTDARPHLGTDRLHGIIGNLSKELVARGGEIVWHTQVTGMKVDKDVLRAVETSRDTIATNCLIPATGANARDTFSRMLDAGVAMQPKPFQMGLRIEHPRELIDRAVFGKWAGHERLGAAEYVLSAEGVTAFCVCPGGVLVAASAEPETVCTNGMSGSARNGSFTNAALVTTVSPEELGTGPLAGLAYQKRWEKRAFELAGGDYSAPAQNVRDFLSGSCRPVSRDTTYPLGVRAVSLLKVLPESVAGAIGRALPEFDRRIHGFAGDAGILVGPETRASCPVRIVRDKESRASTSVDGVYPAGEGSGYSSGIMSSAVDGVKTAEAVIARFAVPCKT